MHRERGAGEGGGGKKKKREKAAERELSHLCDNEVTNARTHSDLGTVPNDFPRVSHGISY